MAMTKEQLIYEWRKLAADCVGLATRSLGQWRATAGATAAGSVGASVAAICFAGWVDFPREEALWVAAGNLVLAMCFRWAGAMFWRRFMEIRQRCLDEASEARNIE